MSKDAPWIALAIDWQDSPMFDDASHGERLAWICLLCFAKAQGRAGKVRLRDMAFSQNYRLSVESVEAMIAGAVKAGAVTVDGDVITVVNWKLYQDPRVRSRTDENHLENKADQPKRRHFSKTSEKDATKHQGPTTKHQGPEETPRSPPLPDDVNSPTVCEVWDAWLAYKAERNERYRPQGLRSAVSHLANAIRQHGETAVVKAIQRAMANNWKGWDQESSFGVRNGKQSATPRPSRRGTSLS